MFVIVLPFSETFRSYILEVVVCLLFLSLKMLRPLSGQTVRGCRYDYKCKYVSDIVSRNL